MPRHPKYNHIGKFGSYKYGRQRLQDVLRTYQLHEQFIALADTPYLEESENETEDLTRNRYLASAFAAIGDVDRAKTIRGEIDKLLTDKKAERKKAGDEAEEKAKKEKKDEEATKKARSDAEGKHNSRVRDLEKAIAEIDGRLAAHAGDAEKELEFYKKAGGVPVEEQVVLMMKLGKKDDAVKKINDHVRSNRNEVRPLAAQVEILWAADKKDDAKKAFEELRKLSGVLDMDVPVFASLKPIAVELGFTADWREEQKIAADIGARPPLDSLGPFRWQPVSATDWSLPDTDNETRSLANYRGKPVVVIFYLGAGCLHCAEQLQKFAPKTEEFRKAGYEVVAISTDKQEVMHLAYKDLDEGFPFPLVSDAEMNVFKAYRCYDDFEQQPLHGTFVIDGAGRIRWQDISYEPFMDPDFVLEEANRLLGQDKSELTTEPKQLTAGQ
jgi:peroxiredoxin